MIYELDNFLIYVINNNWRSPVLDQLMSWITYSGNTPLIFLYIFSIGVIAGIIYRLKYFRLAPENQINPLRKILMIILFSAMIYGVTSGVIQVIKNTAQRPRPHVVHEIRKTEALKNTTAGEDKESFPSGHAAGTFMIVVIISRVFGRKMQVLFGWALLVALSRVYLGAHYPSDVIVGGFLGWLMANLFISKRPFKAIFTIQQGGYEG